VKTIGMAILLAVAPARAISQQGRCAIRRGAVRFCGSLQSERSGCPGGGIRENAVRVTPSGTFLRRAALCHSFEDALNLGLHDYSVKRTDRVLTATWS